MILKEFFVSLGLDADAQSFASGQIAVKTLELGLHALVRVAEKAFDFFKELSTGTIEYGDNIGKTAQRIGVSTDALQELQYAAKLSAVGTEELTQGIGFLARNMDAASRGSKEQSAAFKKAGVAVKDLHGALRPAEDVISDLADHFASLPDGTEKTALSMQLFGRAGKQMIPMLNEGSKGLEKLRKEAHDFGVVLDKATIDQSQEASDNLDRLSTAWKGVKLAIGTNLIGPLSQAAAAIARWLALHRVMIASGIKNTFLAIGNAITLVWHGVKYLIEFFTALVNYLGTVGEVGLAVAIAFAAAWALAAMPIIIIAALFALLLLVLDDVQTALEGGDSLIGKLWDKWNGFIDEWTKPKAGDGWLMLGLKALVHMIMHIGEAWDDAVAYWKSVFVGFFDWIGRKITWVIDKIEEAGHKLKSMAGFGGMGGMADEGYKRMMKFAANDSDIASGVIGASGFGTKPAPVSMAGLFAGAASMAPAGFGVGVATPNGKQVVNHLDMSGMTIQVLADDGKAIADGVTKQIDNWWSTKLREAGN